MAKPKTKKATASKEVEIGWAVKDADGKTASAFDGQKHIYDFRHQAKSANDAIGAKTWRVARVAIVDRGA